MLKASNFSRNYILFPENLARSFSSLRLVKGLKSFFLVFWTNVLTHQNYAFYRLNLSRNLQEQMHRYVIIFCLYLFQILVGYTFNKIRDASKCIALLK